MLTTSSAVNGYGDNDIDNDGEEKDSDDEDTDSEDDSDSESAFDESGGPKGVQKPKKASTAGKSGIYIPPKIKPVYYDGDEKPEDKEKKIIERAKKRAIT